MELFQVLILASIFATSSAHPITGKIYPLQTPIPIPVATSEPTAEPAITTSPFAGPGRSKSQIMACTSTLGITYSRLPSPPYYPWCLFDGTETLYAATETSQRSVDCAGCLDVVVKTYPDGISCPPRATLATTSLDATTTVYETVCSATPTYSDMLEQKETLVPRAMPERRQGDGDDVIATLLLKGAVEAQQAACPTTLIVPQNGVGGTSTRFDKMVTVTSYINCGGCSLYISTRVGGLGPIVRPGITASQPIGTSTSYICTA